MLRVAICFCLIIGLTAPLGARLERGEPSVLTVILAFKGPYSRTSLKEMERESGLVLRSSGVHLDWRMLGENPHASYDDVVVMTFNGACEFNAAPATHDELGPLAMTHSVDGKILPFGEVNCDRVISSARTAMSSDDYFRADLLIGRALGRVVTHELVHMLTKSGEHGMEGVEKPALSGRQLIADDLRLSESDIARLKQKLSYR
jgi:hypothetical protein